jgi:hypothetical protein
MELGAIESIIFCIKVTKNQTVRRYVINEENMKFIRIMNKIWVILDYPSYIFWTKNRERDLPIQKKINYIKPVWPSPWLIPRSSFCNVSGGEVTLYRTFNHIRMSTKRMRTVTVIITFTKEAQISGCKLKKSCWLDKPSMPHEHVLLYHV